MRETIRFRLRAVVLVGAAFLVTGCAAAPRPTPARPSQSSGGEGDASAALMRLEDARAFDGAALARFAGSPLPPVRARTALTLGRLGRAESLALLNVLLADPDTAVAATAAFALGEVGDTAAVPALVRLLGSPDSAPATVRAETAAALGKLRTDAAHAALLSMLRDAPPTDSLAVGAALLAIWRYPRPADLAPLLRWADSPSGSLRWRAAYALVRRPEPRALRVMLALSRDPDPRVRALALRALTATQADSAGVAREDALARLFDGARDPDYASRINAVRSLASYPAPAVVDTLRTLARGADRHVAVTALEAIGRMGAAARASSADLAAIAADDAVPVFLRQTTLEALAAVDPPAAVRSAASLRTAPSWRLRASAARAFAAAGREGREGLRVSLRDPDPRVANAALEAAVGAVGDSLAPLRPLLLEQLGARDVIVRTTALTALGRIADEAMLPLLLDAYAVAQHDTLNDAALAAVAALGSLRAAGSDVARAFLARFPRSPDYLVRVRAREAFGPALVEAWGEPLPLDGAASPPRDPGLPRSDDEGPGGRNAPEVIIRTEAGSVRLRLFERDAPLTTRNFLALAGRGYFDGQEWPRVVPNFVVQGGDPRGDTNGGPGYTIRDEINRNRYGVGTVGMALSGPDTGGSQFFITHSPQPHLDGTYTVFGEVVAGQDVVERILPGEIIHSVRPAS